MLLPETRCHNLPRTKALAILAAWLLVCCAFLLAADNPAPVAGVDAEGNRGGDLALYQAVVERMMLDESYYDVLGDELSNRNYPLLPVFNWRTPLHLGMIANLPTELLQGIALLLIGFTLMIQLRWMDAAGSPKFFTYLAAVLSVPALIPAATGTGIYFPELWAGVLIWASICCYGNRWTTLGIVLALAALFVRELAIIYVGIAAYFAIRSRNQREMTILSFGLLTYAVYYFLHWLSVQSVLTFYINPEARNWVAVGGAGFLQETLRMNPLFAMGPDWLRAIALPSAVLGALACPLPSARHARWAIGAYVIFFSVAGLPFNFYWGGLYLACIAWGLAWFAALAVSAI